MFYYLFKYSFILLVIIFGVKELIYGYISQKWYNKPEPDLSKKGIEALREKKYLANKMGYKKAAKKLTLQHKFWMIANSQKEIKGGQIQYGCAVKPNEANKIINQNKSKLDRLKDGLLYLLGTNNRRTNHLTFSSLLLPSLFILSGYFSVIATIQAVVYLIIAWVIWFVLSRVFYLRSDFIRDGAVTTKTAKLRVKLFNFFKFVHAMILPLFVYVYSLGFGLIQSYAGDKRNLQQSALYYSNSFITSFGYVMISILTIYVLLNLGMLIGHAVLKLTGKEIKPFKPITFILPTIAIYLSLMMI